MLIADYEILARSPPQFVGGRGRALYNMQRKIIWIGEGFGCFSSFVKIDLF